MRVAYRTRRFRLITARVCLLFALNAALGAQSKAQTAEEYAAKRERMVERQIVGRGIKDPQVLRVMREVPRHLFVPHQLLGSAYDDRPLLIGHGQTISQPYIVALMTELLEIKPGDRVFEVGTGSGYQAAVLAELGARVFSMEIIRELAESAASRLETMDYDSLTVIRGDGYFGLPEEAPFDAIIVTCAADHVPPPLLRQLTPGGRMCIPVGGRFSTQNLVLVRKDRDGRITTDNVLPVQFVPLTGEH